MKLLLTSLLVALASSTVIAAAPETPASAPAAQVASDETPSPERVELARKFLAVSAPAEAMMEGVSQGFWHAASATLMEIDDEAERSVAEERLDGLLSGLEPKLTELMPGLMEAYAQVYAREFSADELRAMIAFAETPAGKHYLARQALLDADPTVIDAMQELMSGLAPMLEDFSKEMCAERAAQRLAAGDKKATCPLTAEPESASG